MKKLLYSILLLAVACSSTLGQSSPAKSDLALKSQADQIANENQPGANTALRVGNMFRAIVASKPNVTFGVTATGTNTYTAIPAIPIPSYRNGDMFLVTFTNSNSGASTIDFGFGAQPLVNNKGLALTSGDIASNSAHWLVYQSVGTSFKVVTLSGLSGGGTGLVMSVTGDGVNNTDPYNPVIEYSNNLQALNDLSSTGIISRTGSGTFQPRTLNGTANQIDIVNGNGILGDPVLSLSSTLILPSGTTTPDKTQGDNSGSIANTKYVDTGLNGKASVTKLQKTVSTTTYTIVSGDNGYLIHFTNAAGCTVTMDNLLGTGFNFIGKRDTGAGVILFASDGTSVLNSIDGELDIEKEEGWAQWVKKNATNYDGNGDLGPAGGGGAGLVDGDYGDITVGGSGTTMTIDNLAVTNAKINSVAYSKLTSVPTATTSTDGILLATEWNLFNNKQDALVSGTNIKTVNGSSILGSGNLSIAGGVSSIATTAPITGGTITSTGTIGITQASTSTDGYLSSINWNTFNGKQNAITFGTGVLTALGVNIGSAGAPVLYNGNAGIPSAIVLTNATGTASGLTAGNVTTNANLTGPITSVGNATSVASQTGTGSTFVMSVSPTFTGVPIVPTATAGTNSTQAASTAFVATAFSTPLSNPQTTNYTLQASDVGKEIPITSASLVTITLPASTFADGNFIGPFYQTSTGGFAFTTSGGATVTYESGSATTTETLRPVIVKYVTGNAYYVFNGTPPGTGGSLTRTNDTNVTATLTGDASDGLRTGKTIGITLGWTGTLAVTRGGTGLSAVTSTRIPYATGTNTLGESANLTFNGSTLTVTGGIALGYAAKTANYTLTSADRFVECTANSFTITLPTAVGRTGIIYTVDNSGAGTITLATTSSQTIDGASPGSLTAGQKITLYSNGANWRTF